MSRRIASVALLAVLVVSLGCSRREAGDGGRAVIQNKGSDTLVNVAQAWAENYKEVNPNVAVAVTGGGSGTGISAMINGTVDLANASRKMKTKELEAARANGIDPIEWIVGYDALAVFLHPNNPIENFTLAQLAEIYGEGGTVDEWSQMEVEIPGCDSGELVRVSRQNNSGHVRLFQGDGSRAGSGTTSWALGTCTARRTSWTWSSTRPAPLATAASPMPRKQVKMPCVMAEEAGDCVRADRRDRHRPHLSDRPAAVHVYRRSSPTGASQGLSRLDPQRRGSVHHPGQGLCSCPVRSTCG